MMGTPVLMVEPKVRGMMVPPEHKELGADEECLGLLFPALRPVYAGTGCTGVESRGLFSPEGAVSFHTVVEAVIAFPSAAAAQKVFADRSAQWSRCSGRTIPLIPVNADQPQTPQQWKVGRLTRSDETVAVRRCVDAR